MPTFDLREEPWIPVVCQDGKTEEVGLRRALVEAHLFVEISDPIPIVEFGLYRLLVALVMDVFELRGIRGLLSLLEAGRFDPNQVDSYLERWGDRFDLFHAQYPFLQTSSSGGKTKPLAALLPAIPSGTNALHFHRHTEDEFAACPAAAARLLATIAPFMTAGGTGLSPSINGAPPWYVMPRGGALFETVCLNCCVLPLPGDRKDAPPAWRDPRPASPGRRAGASLLEALSWRPRQVRLIPSDAGICSLTGRESSVLVCTMHFSPGASSGFLWTDPNVPYRITSEKVTPLRPKEGRELWRDTGPISLLQDKDYESHHGRGIVRFNRPVIMTQFAHMASTGLLPCRPKLDLVAYGMRTDLNMKVFEWQREALAVPVPLLSRSSLCAEAQRASEQAEAVASAIAQCARAVYPRGGADNRAGFGRRIAAAHRRYWADLRSDFETLLWALAALPVHASIDEAQPCLRHWRDRLWQVGMAALEQAIGDLDTDAALLARQVHARSDFQVAFPGC